MNLRYTTQTAYEKMRRYFSKPGASIAYDEEIQTCQYRTADGRKCAVGCLIPDSLYTDAMENNPATKAIEIAGLRDMFGDVEKEFLLEAQSAHDNVETVEELVSTLDALAEAHGLKLALS